MTTERMHAACWMSKSKRAKPYAHAPTQTRTHPPTRTHTQICNTVLIVFPQQQWFRKRASVLRYTDTGAHLAFPSHLLYFPITQTTRSLA